MADIDDRGDEQDLAEVFDETNITRDGVDIAHPDMARSVHDATSAAGNADDDERGADEDFDPDQADEAERESLLEADDGVDSEDDLDGGDSADLVATDDPDPADFEAGAVGVLAEGDVATVDPHVDRQLDRGLKETFPASDPLSINPGAD